MLLACTDIYEDYRRRKEPESEYPPLLEILSYDGLIVNPSIHDPFKIARAWYYFRPYICGIVNQDSSHVPTTPEGLSRLYQVACTLYDFASDSRTTQTPQLNIYKSQSKKVIDVMVDIIQRHENTTKE